jgi:hypothetical protein
VSYHEEFCAQWVLNVQHHEAVLTVCIPSKYLPHGEVSSGKIEDLRTMYGTLEMQWSQLDALSITVRTLATTPDESDVACATFVALVTQAFVNTQRPKIIPFARKSRR